MKRYKVWCVCLLAWLIGWSGWALADSRYDALCRERSVNKADAAAWIEIPGSGLCQPIMQHAADDGFYSSHDAAGKDWEFGALFTQASYNARDFSDPVTVVYGSSKAAGAPLRDLQEMYSGSFDKCRKISLHLPGETRQYEVFAAVPYSSIHILHYYNFSSERRFDAFFDGVFSSRLLGMHLDESAKPSYGDQVLILSTGIRGDQMQRYLVMAKLVN